MAYDRFDRNLAAVVAILIVSLVFSIAMAFGAVDEGSDAAVSDNPAADNAAWGP